MLRENLVLINTYRYKQKLFWVKYLIYSMCFTSTISLNVYGCKNTSLRRLKKLTCLFDNLQKNGSISEHSAVASELKEIIKLN
ncbi:hypothetical protein HZS_6040 [Henneguya salminicola]|nr:hypothetical protein HZS_6040 [Henneguya salminicola]